MWNMKNNTRYILSVIAIILTICIIAIIDGYRYIDPSSNLAKPRVCSTTDIDCQYNRR